MSKGTKIIGTGLVVYLLLMVAAIVGWSMNVYGLCKCDFEPSYRAEIIRGIGVVLPPVGAIVGYVGVEDEAHTKAK